MLTPVQLAQAAKALSSPTRVQMLMALAKGRSCRDLPQPAGLGLATSAEPEEGVCVCEFQEQLGLSQSKVSYHLGILRSAGLIEVHERGRWSFYLLCREGLRVILDSLGSSLELANPSQATTSIPTKGCDK